MNYAKRWKTLQKDVLLFQVTLSVALYGVLIWAKDITVALDYVEDTKLYYRKQYAELPE